MKVAPATAGPSAPFGQAEHGEFGHRVAVVVLQQLVKLAGVDAGFGAHAALLPGFEVGGDIGVCRPRRRVNLLAQRQVFGGGGVGRGGCRSSAGASVVWAASGAAASARIRASAVLVVLAIFDNILWSVDCLARSLACAVGRKSGAKSMVRQGSARCEQPEHRNEKGPEDRPFSDVVFCSLSDWPTSWRRTLRRNARAVNGILTVCGNMRTEKNRAFSRARPVNREEVTAGPPAQRRDPTSSDWQNGVNNVCLAPRTGQCGGPRSAVQPRVVRGERDGSGQCGGQHFRGRRGRGLRAAAAPAC